METHLRTSHLRVERKQFTFDLRENPQGMFLRITEEVSSGRRDSIIIPMTGLELFRDSLNEIIKFNQAPVSGTVLPLGQRKAETPIPDGSADLTMWS
jgi:hypothetical protein